MHRQEALNVIWRKLFLVFVLLLLLSIALTEHAGDFKVPLLVFITGNIGGYVGLHRRLAEIGDEEIKNLSNSWFGIILPSFIGGILACVMYTLFIANIIEGELFPKIIRDTSCTNNANLEKFDVIFCQHADGYRSYAKLLFWSFVAGFNQKYVVDVIDSIKGNEEKP